MITASGPQFCAVNTTHLRPQHHNHQQNNPKAKTKSSPLATRTHRSNHSEPLPLSPPRPSQADPVTTIEHFLFCRLRTAGSVPSSDGDAVVEPNVITRSSLDQSPRTRRRPLPPSLSPVGFGIAAFAEFPGGPLPSPKTPRNGEHRPVVKENRSMTSQISSPLREIHIAVVGAKGVGKSTFIQKAYHLKSAPGKGDDNASLKLTVGGTPCTVTLVEFDWSKFDFESQPLQWPAQAADGQSLSFAGVLILYSCTDPASIAGLPSALDAFSKAVLPVVVVACKVDSPQRQLNPVSVAQVGTVRGYEQVQTSTPESYKRCVAAILSTIVHSDNEKNSRYLNGRQRANSSSASNNRAASPSTSAHNRASSEFSGSFLKDTFEGTSSHGVNSKLSRPPVSQALGTLAINSTASKTPSFPLDPKAGDAETLGLSSRSAPQITLGTSPTAPAFEVVSTSPFSMQAHNGGASSQSSLPSQLSSVRTRNSFTETDDENGFKDLDEIPILEREGDVDDFDDDEKPVQNRGYAWDELVDRLLGQPMSRSDQTFVIVFLSFYRKFAPPRDLLCSIIDRFERASNDQRISLHRISVQVRHCSILHQWVTSHPGDFAHPKTKQILLAFLAAIAGNRSLSVLVNEMQRTLAIDVEDEDASWGKTDESADRKASMQSYMTTSTFPDAQGGATESLGTDLNKSKTTLGVPRTEADPAKRISEAASYDSTSTSESSQGLVSIRSDNSNPSPNPFTKLSSSQYDLFMSIPDEEIAGDLTRIDWAEFCQVRPRDLIRHVEMPRHQRENTHSLTHMNKMISHFNHVAYWVASVILEKQKPKHRAKALEKFMTIAWKLRHQNNYNSLGAVIAGINGTAVYRLNMTRELVNPDIQKRFMQLELLMGTHKSHSRYRLAWENTSKERIPFLPLHRRDLVSADEGNSTFLQGGEKINWNKFQVMGDVLMVVVQSQIAPYKALRDNPIVERLISDAVLSMDDDGLYERSVQLENSQSTTARGSKAAIRFWR